MRPETTHGQADGGSDPTDGLPPNTEMPSQHKALSVPAA
jgi:hypothetical protein